MLLGFDHPARDLIRARSSVRRYDGRPLEARARGELERCCRALGRGPLGSRCRFQLVDNRTGAAEAGRGVGAYGTIRGARTYLAGAVEEGPHGLEDFGYLFELLVLKATDLDLGTCWIGGVFSRGGFARALGLKHGEQLVAVSPVGVPAQRRSLYDRLVRWGAGSASRRPWGELFYDAQAEQPLEPEVAGEFATALEMVRLAPSASNRQPWRVQRRCAAPQAGGEEAREGREAAPDGSEAPGAAATGAAAAGAAADRPGQGSPLFHFFLLRFPGYRSLTSIDLQRVDLGIAMAHFDLGLDAAGMSGTWAVLEPAPQPGPRQWQRGEYVVSWRPEPSALQQP